MMTRDEIVTLIETIFRAANEAYTRGDVETGATLRVAGWQLQSAHGLGTKVENE